MKWVNELYLRLEDINSVYKRLEMINYLLFVMLRINMEVNVGVFICKLYVSCMMEFDFIVGGYGGIWSFLVFYIFWFLVWVFLCFSLVIIFLFVCE